MSLPALEPRYSEYHEEKRAVATWLTSKDYELFVEIAHRNGVTPAAYLRAVVVDILAEEGPKVKTLFTKDAIL